MAGARRPVYVISIAAGLAGCHPRTLRIYEEEGLLDPVRTDTNIRLYSDEDLDRVRAIRYLTQIRGVNLAGVKLLLQLRNAAEFLDEIASELTREDAEAPQTIEVTHEPMHRKPRTRQRQKGVEL
jgi:MerR family transcriptional regulator/heat shock protein HspR